MKAPRPYIGMWFKCCHVYTRIYLNRDGTAFVGFCPKCGARATVKVAPGGSRSRFWKAE
ncbi:MAG TPA: hypothetical protein PKY35_14140 [Candidatus Hydrogenedentes bacterium]|nr:hypothetical protein [Candidatus Hydrogenedentota bacterium]HOL78161.1 hypothetical protein [Candidatus Hydrogenedentota bacterium]